MFLSLVPDPARWKTCRPPLWPWKEDQRSKLPERMAFPHTRPVHTVHATQPGRQTEVNVTPCDTAAQSNVMLNEWMQDTLNSPQSEQKSPSQFFVFFKYFHILFFRIEPVSSSVKSFHFPHIFNPKKCNLIKWRWSGRWKNIAADTFDLLGSGLLMQNKPRLRFVPCMQPLGQVLPNRIILSKCHRSMYGAMRLPSKSQWPWCYLIHNWRAAL